MTGFKWQWSDAHENVMFASLGQWKCARIIETNALPQKPFHFRCYLPVREPVGFAATLKEAKEAAERLVNEFLASAGLEQKHD